MNLDFKAVEYSDLDEINSLQPEGWASIEEDFRYHINNPFATTIKACVNDKLVGVGIALNFGETAWLDQIIVNPDYRGKGIGYKIVDYLMRELDALSTRTVQLIATPLGESVYKKFGFSEISTYVSLEKTSNEKFSYSQKILKCTPDHFEDLLKMDKEINGEDRSLLLKPYLKDAMVYFDGSLQGYFFPNLYEGPIYAKYDQAAKELMKLKSSNAQKAILPSENQNAIVILNDLGFENQKIIGKRMLWGKPIKWKPTMIYNRVGGNYG